MRTKPRPATMTPRNPNLRLSALCSLSLAAALSGCGNEDQPQDGSLQAILDDGELTTMVQSAQMVGPKGGAMGTGGIGGGATGGSVGSGGVGGGAGSFPPPPPGGKGGGTGGSGGGPSMGGIGGGSCDEGGGGFGGFGPVADGGMAPGGPIKVDAGVPFPMEGGGSGGKGGNQSCFNGPIGFWDFNDCNDSRTQLNDSSFNGNTAFRSVKAACVEGASGSGVNLPNAKDIVYVPDQPTFTFAKGVTVAAWINPRKLGGVQTIFRKREGGTSSLAFVLNGKNLQFIIDRKGASPASVDWKGITEGVWTHVAAAYDGTELRLYINGKHMVGKRAVGTIDGGEGPLLIGNDGSLRRFGGAIDNVWFATASASDDVIMGLTCLPQGPTLVGTPANRGPVAAGTSFTFDLALTNKNSASCAPVNFQFFQSSFVPDVTINPSFSFLTVASGETRHIPVVVTAQSEAEPGERLLSFQARNDRGFDSEPATANVTFVIAEPTGCRVKTSRELMIKHLSVVDDPVRTTFNQPGDARTGLWTFKHLMEQMAPTASAAPDMVEAMFQTWLTPQTVNTFTIPPRPSMQDLVLNSWPRTSNGKLDLARAPLQLQAIVNRFDLRNLDQNNAGEGRFVFAVLNPGGMFPMEFTMILEYKLPAKTLGDVQQWANDWHALGDLTFPSEAYNTALATLTERFAKRGAAPGRPNGSAINTVRSNEIALSFVWELREFRMDAATGLLRPATIQQSPDLGFNNSPALGEWINENQTAIIAETHEVPLTFKGVPFATGSVFNDLSAWDAPGVDPEARHHFSLNTCNGCHSSEETNTGFLQISPRFPGGEAGLSGFLTGTTVFDFRANKERTFNDLGRRNADLKAIVCPAPTPVKGVAARTQAAPAPADAERLRHGIQRVH